MPTPRPRQPARDVRAPRGDGCFHCGAPIPAQSGWHAGVRGAMRSFCCAGCLAVAQTIQAAGLDGFYAARTAQVSAPPAETLDDDWFRLADAAREAGLVRELDGGRCEATLLLDGLRCGACAWLIESWLAGRPGVTSAQANFATSRARLVWRDRDTSLATLLRGVAALGYRAHPYDPACREALARAELRSLLVRMGIAVLAMMQVMMLALPAYVSAETVEPLHRALLGWASFVLTLPVIAYSAWPTFRGAWRDLANRRLGMDVPVALGLAAAFAASAWATFTGIGDTYYDTVTMFVALFLVARYVELVGRQRAGDAIERLARFQPATAERLDAWPASQAATPVAAHALAVGDTVLVRPGAIVPADGVVLDGASKVQEALLTGESHPRPVLAGDALVAGAINGASPLVMRVQAAGEATRLAAIVRLVESAASERPRIALVADRAASFFVAALLALALATALAWWQIEPSRSLAITFALLVVSCPCALSLATPAAVAAGVGALSTRQVMVVRANALETLACVTRAVFDKTGTLTLGRLALRDMLVVDAGCESSALAIAAALEAGSEHPIAEAFTAACAAPSARAFDVRAVAGRGIEGTIGGVRYRIGRPDFVAALAGPSPARAEAFLGAATASTIVALGSAGGTHALFALDDAVRPGARETIAALRALGIASTLLSGDRTACATSIAREIGIGDARGDLDPEAKLSAVRELQARGEVVAMIGDGINDAPSLAGAQVSITLGDATALAQRTADVLVLSDALPAIPRAIVHARRTLAIVRQNVGWALAYNAIAIPAAAFGLVTPLAAAAGMTLSSLVVVVNALRAARIADRTASVPSAMPGAATRYAI